MSIIYFPFLCIMGWSSVFESSNISGLQDIEMRLPKLFNADFAVETSEFNFGDVDLRKQTDKRLAFQMLS